MGSLKKKILVVFTGAMELGGIERSLIGLLDAIDYEKYEVDLFLYAHRGPLYDQINKNVNILPEVKELSYLRDSMKEKIFHGCYYSMLLRIIDEIKSKFFPVDPDKTWDIIAEKFITDLRKEYDIALGFFLPFGLLKNKVNAKVKVGWIHTDYQGEICDKKILKRQYSGLDRIAAVSDSCKNSFIELYPVFSDKVMTIENILSKENIKKLSKEYIPDELDKSTINLLSIGRFCHAKNFDNIPEICKLVREKNFNVKWYLIGFGGAEELIRSKIIEYGMEEYVVILGKKENPYPYLKNCNVYIQPSRYEGKCVAVREAQILEKPVIITNYFTASSQLINGYDGVIVPQENQSCAYGICEVLKDKQFMKELSRHCAESDYTNAKEIEKMYNLIFD